MTPAEYDQWWHEHKPWISHTPTGMIRVREGPLLVFAGLFAACFAAAFALVIISIISMEHLP